MDLGGCYEKQNSKTAGSNRLLAGAMIVTCGNVTTYATEQTDESVEVEETQEEQADENVVVDETQNNELYGANMRKVKKTRRRRWILHMQGKSLMEKKSM